MDFGLIASLDLELSLDGKALHHLGAVLYDFNREAEVDTLEIKPNRLKGITELLDFVRQADKAKPKAGSAFDANNLSVSTSF